MEMMGLLITAGSTAQSRNESVDEPQISLSKRFMDTSHPPMSAVRVSVYKTTCPRRSFELGGALGVSFSVCM